MKVAKLRNVEVGAGSFNPVFAPKTIFSAKNENTPYILSVFYKIPQKTHVEKYVKSGYYIFLYFFKNVK